MLLILLVGVAGVSANTIDDDTSISVSDTNTATVGVSNDVSESSFEITANVDSGENNNVLLGSSSENVLGDGEVDSDSLYDLNLLIGTTVDGGTLHLEKNYAYNCNTDAVLVNGINIDKQMTIEGNGMTINAGDRKSVV